MFKNIHLVHYVCTYIFSFKFSDTMTLCVSMPKLLTLYHILQSVANKKRNLSPLCGTTLIEDTENGLFIENFMSLMCCGYLTVIKNCE